MKQLILPLLIGLPLIICTGDNTDKNSIVDKHVITHGLKAGLWLAAAYGGYKGSILLQNASTQNYKDVFEFLDWTYENRKNRIPCSLYEIKNNKLYSKQYSEFKKHSTLHNLINVEHSAHKFLEPQKFLPDVEKYRLATKSLHIALLSKQQLFLKAIQIITLNTMIKIAPIACAVTPLYFVSSHLRSMYDGYDSKTNTQKS